MTLDVKNDITRHLSRAVQNFRSLGEVKAFISYNGLGSEGHFVCCLELLRNKKEGPILIKVKDILTSKI